MSTYEDWREIEEFPGYSVSNQGRVRNDDRGRVLTRLVNQHGVVHVGLVKGRLQYKRGVALLVALAFLPEPYPMTFDTVIHLDGDKLNCRMDNLMWRPRWFAIRFHQQFRRDGMSFTVPIEDTKTGERFKNSMQAVCRYGLLDKEILTAVAQQTYVWPTYQTFRVVYPVDTK